MVTRPDWYPSLATERQGRYPAAWSELGQGQEFALADPFDSTVRQIGQLGSPFDGYMEAPLVVQAFYTEHADEIRAPLAELRSRLRVLLRELTCTLWSLDPKATVNAEAVRAHGFDPNESAPDPIDYW